MSSVIFICKDKTSPLLSLNNPDFANSGEVHMKQILHMLKQIQKYLPENITLMSGYHQ